MIMNSYHFRSRNDINPAAMGAVRRGREEMEVGYEGVIEDDAILNAAQDAFDDDDFQEAGPSTANRVFRHPAAADDPEGRGRGNVDTVAEPGARAPGTGGLDPDFQDVSVAAGFDSGTGGNAGDQSTMVPFGFPIYRPLNGNIHGFQKRWYFMLPVYNQCVISTQGGQSPLTRQLFYFPGMWDFDPNLLGWYTGGDSASDLGFLQSFTNQGGCTVKVQRASMKATVLAINAPFNTQATNQGTANGQLHLVGAVGSNLSRLGVSAVGCAQFSAQAAGAHNITKIRFDEDHPEANTLLNILTHWITYVETSTLSGLADPTNTNGIFVLNKPDATEGFRHYPMVFGFKCNYTTVQNGTARVVRNYPDYPKDMTHITIGPGKLFSAGGKRKNCHLSLQAYDQAVDVNYRMGTLSKAGILSSFSSAPDERVAQLEAGFVQLRAATKLLDNNAQSAGVGMSGSTLKPHVQVCITPPPTTTDSITTAQVAYVQIMVDTMMDCEFRRDHWDEERNVCHESSTRLKWCGDIIQNGTGNGVVDFRGRECTYGNIFAVPTTAYTNIV